MLDKTNDIMYDCVGAMNCLLSTLATLSFTGQSTEDDDTEEACFLAQQKSLHMMRQTVLGFEDLLETCHVLDKEPFCTTLRRSRQMMQRMEIILNDRKLLKDTVLQLAGMQAIPQNTPSKTNSFLGRYILGCLGVVVCQNSPVIH